MVEPGVVTRSVLGAVVFAVLLEGGLLENESKSPVLQLVLEAVGAVGVGAKAEGLA